MRAGRVRTRWQTKWRPDPQNPNQPSSWRIPAKPPQLSDTIQRATSLANAIGTSLSFHGWPETDIAGRPLVGPILDEIDKASFLVADITHLNFNVTYEIGFAIGSSKRVLLIRNDEFVDERNFVQRVGIFDTLGYLTYTNSNSLKEILVSEHDLTPLRIGTSKDIKAPVYLLETPHRSDAMSRIASRIKKARCNIGALALPRIYGMAANEAIQHIAVSHGVLVPLLSPNVRDADIHNIRAAFWRAFLTPWIYRL